MKSVCLIVQNDYEFDVRARRKAEALVESGYLVDVLALRGSNGRRSYTLNGVHVETVRIRKKRGTLARYGFEYVAFLLWAFVKVHVLAWRKRYAVVDVNTLPDFLVFAPLFARSMGTRLLLDMHEITPEFYMSKYGAASDSWVIRLLTFIERMSMNFADHVVTVNDPILELLVGRGLNPRKATVIMNAVDERRFAEPSAAAGVADRTGVTFVLMYHGTLTRIYGLDIAIEAFSVAQKRMPGAQLWIVGWGPQLQELKVLARQRGLEASVRIVGKVPSRQIGKWLAQSDAGVLPTRSDVFLEFTFPNKLPEYIVTGKPVIASRLKAIRRYFDEDALAYVTPSDPADLARQMVRLYRDRDLRSSLAARAMEQYAPIRWEVMGRRYVNLVNQLSSVRPLDS